MKVRVNDYCPGELTQDDFYNVRNWETSEYDEYEMVVNITFYDVERVEKLGDGLRIVFNDTESHYFNKFDYSTIVIL